MNPVAIAGFWSHGLTIGLATAAFTVIGHLGNPAASTSSSPAGATSGSIATSGEERFRM